jgi:hypothetical protein
MAWPQIGLERAIIVIPAKGLPSKYYFDRARKLESPFFNALKARRFQLSLE